MKRNYVLHLYILLNIYYNDELQTIRINIISLILNLISFFIL